ncbi:MAG TPA: TlpA disulfide reductase family protein [Micromonosporaceae bacterium]|nr:TlpA disulfide reductase family protein [Micromonosporaceae bacterium]
MIRKRAAVTSLAFVAAAMLIVGGTAACSSSGTPARVTGTCLSSSAPAASAAAPAVTSGAQPPTATSTPAVTSAPTATDAPTVTGVRAGLRIPAQPVDCFDGSGTVRLDVLTKPAVVNLWASYCLPCHAELPNVEAFAKAAGTSVTVVGVDTADERNAARSVVADLGLTYPMVFDPGQHIYQATAGRGLPATLFVAPGGVVRYVYESGTILDTAHLEALAAQYLGVTVHG